MRIERTMKRFTEALAREELRGWSGELIRHTIIKRYGEQSVSGMGMDEGGEVCFDYDPSVDWDLIRQDILDRDSSWSSDSRGPENATVVSTYIQDDWIQLVVTVDVPLGADPPQDVVLTAFYARFDGIKLLELTAERPKCFED